MKILNISNELREGLACAASLALRGHRVIDVHLGSHFRIHRLRVQLDTGTTTLKHVEIPYTSIKSTKLLKYYSRVIEQLIGEEFSNDLDVVVTSSSYHSFYITRTISRTYNTPLVVRISDLGILGKFKEALTLFHWYKSIFELPVALVRLGKAIASADIIIAHTASISKFVESHAPRRSILIYPTYARVIPEDQVNTLEMINNIESTVDTNKPIILSVITVKRGGLAGEHDRKSLKGLYLVTKYNPHVTVVVIGSDYNEALEVLGKDRIPFNLKFLGKIHNDLVLEYTYKRASLVLVPFFFRKTISNRLIESLFYKRPTLTNTCLSEDFPWLKRIEKYMFSRLDELPYHVKYIIKSEEALDILEENVKAIWEKELSDRVFGSRISATLQHLNTRR